MPPCELIPEAANAEDLTHAYPLPVRACFVGIIVWSCPQCGHITKSRLNRSTYRLRCGDRDCRKRFGFGWTLYALDHLKFDRMPPDWETFPLAKLAAIMPNAPAHALASMPMATDGGAAR